MQIEFLRPTALAATHYDIGDQAVVKPYLGRQLLAGSHPKAKQVVEAAADPAAGQAKRIKPDGAHRAEVVADDTAGLTTKSAAAMVKKEKK